MATPHRDRRIKYEKYAQNFNQVDSQAHIREKQLIDLNVEKFASYVTKRNKNVYKMLSIMDEAKRI